MNIFEKPPLDNYTLIAHWRDQGIAVSDVDAAIRHLNTVGYYRLSSYAKFILRVERTNLTYERIWELYKFDRELRLLTLDALERIEVALRALLSNNLCLLGNNPHWFMDCKYYNNSRDSITIQKIIANSIGLFDTNRRKEFTKYYFNNFDAPFLPPSWMSFESLSWGDLRTILKYIKKEYKKPIAEFFGIRSIDAFESWIGSLRVTRNTCAHHARLFMMKNDTKAQSSPSKGYPEFTSSADKYYASAVMICYLLKHIAPSSSWGNRLYELFQTYHAPVVYMDFPEQWHIDSFWAIPQSSNSPIPIV